MNNSYREIERKFTMEQDLDVAFSLLKDYFKFVKIERTVSCITKDFYWRKLPNGAIVRLRDSWGEDSQGFSTNLKEITTKIQDKGSNFNRSEKNLQHYDSPTALSLLTDILDKPNVLLIKDERIIFLEEGVVVSLARVESNNFLYLEVEGVSEITVNFISYQIEKIFEVKSENRSLYEIYVDKV